MQVLEVIIYTIHSFLTWKCEPSSNGNGNTYKSRQKDNLAHIMTLTIGLAKLHANPCLVLAEILEEAIQHFMIKSLKFKVPENELKNHSRNMGFILQKEI